nr:uncharacterized protein LOC127312414 [Lolium perenne]
MLPSSHLPDLGRQTPDLDSSCVARVHRSSLQPLDSFELPPRDLDVEAVTTLCVRPSARPVQLCLRSGGRHHVAADETTALRTRLAAVQDPLGLAESKATPEDRKDIPSSLLKKSPLFPNITCGLQVVSSVLCQSASPPHSVETSMSRPSGTLFLGAQQEIARVYRPAVLTSCRPYPPSSFYSNPHSGSIIEATSKSRPLFSHGLPCNHSMPFQKSNGGGRHQINGQTSIATSVRPQIQEQASQVLRMHSQATRFVTARLKDNHDRAGIEDKKRGYMQEL